MKSHGITAVSQHQVFDSRTKGQATTLLSYVPALATQVRSFRMQATIRSFFKILNFPTIFPSRRGTFSSVFSCFSVTVQDTVT